MKNIISFLMICAISFLCYSCGSTGRSESFVRENVDIGFITRVAVLPFENNSGERFAAERSRNIAITQILALGIADVIDKGLVDSVLLEEAVEPDKPIDQMTIKRLGQRLNVQAFLMGTVDTFGSTRRGNQSFPEISLTLRLIDARAAMILWQASGYQSGETIIGRLIGLPPSDSFQVSMKLVKQLLSTVPQPQPAT